MSPKESECAVPSPEAQRSRRTADGVLSDAIRERNHFVSDPQLPIVLPVWAFALAGATPLQPEQ
jgi:hypothetical protein